MVDNNDVRELGLVQQILLAIVLGGLSALVAYVFREMISLVQNLIFANEVSWNLGLKKHIPHTSIPYLVIVIPAIFGVFVVWITTKFAPEAKGHGVPEVIDSIQHKGGNISPNVVVVKTIASSVTLGSGGSAGREGPVVQICATIGSILATLFKTNSRQKVIFVAASAAAGIAATFNTPLGGIMFVAELLLLEITSLSLFVVSVAVASAIYINQLLIGSAPALNIEAIRSSILYAPSLYETSLYIPLGIILGLTSIVFIKGLYLVEDFFESRFSNKYIRHIIAMLIVGVMLYVCYVLYGEYYIGGVGYATIVDLLVSSDLTLHFLITITVLKMLATFLTLGTGGSGGIFTPSLFIGASVGGAVAIFVSLVTPLEPSVVDFVIAGMAGMISATTGALLTAVVMAFEMTRNYDAILPVLITAAISYRIRYVIYSDDIYTLKVARRGVNIKHILRSDQ